MTMVEDAIAEHWRGGKLQSESHEQSQPMIYGEDMGNTPRAGNFHIHNLHNRNFLAFSLTLMTFLRNCKRHPEKLEFKGTAPNVLPSHFRMKWNSTESLRKTFGILHML